MALDEGVCVQMHASAVLIPDTKFMFPIVQAIIWNSEYVWTRWWSEQLLLVAEIDYDLSSHNGRKTERRIGIFWRQTQRHCCLYGAALRSFKTLFMKLYNVMIPGGPGQAGSLLLRGHGNWCVIKLKLLQENKTASKLHSRWRPRIFTPGLCLEGMLR